LFAKKAHKLHRAIANLQKVGVANKGNDGLILTKKGKAYILILSLNNKRGG
jgi:hypothetical protein